MRRCGQSPVSITTCGNLQVLFSNPVGSKIRTFFVQFPENVNRKPSPTHGSMTVKIASVAQNFEDGWKPRSPKQNEIVLLPFKCAEEWRLRKLVLLRTARSLKHTRYLHHSYIVFSVLQMGSKSSLKRVVCYSYAEIGAVAPPKLCRRGHP